MNWSYGFLKPTVKYRQLNYELSEAQLYTNNSPSTGSAMASLDSGLYFDRKPVSSASTCCKPWSRAFTTCTPATKTSGPAGFRHGRTHVFL